MADSTSPLVKGLGDPMKTATQAADKAAHAVEDVTATLPPPSTMAAPEPDIRSPGQDIHKPAQAQTQLTSLTTKETRVVATVQPAVDTLPPKMPVVDAANAAPVPEMNSPRAQNIFDLAVGFLRLHKD